MISMIYGKSLLRCSGRTSASALQAFLYYETKIYRTQEVKTTQQEAHDWMLTTLPSEENPNIDKFAILLKPVPENPEPCRCIF